MNRLFIFQNIDKNPQVWRALFRRRSVISLLPAGALAGRGLYKLAGILQFQ